MKKRIYNFFLMFLLVFAIFSCDNKPQDVIYTITLNAPDSTSKGDEKLYYNATTGLYYSSSQMTTPITSITKPEKVWNINIVGNGDSESLSKSFIFGGYKDPSVTSKDANEDMFIGGDGKIDKSKKVSKDITLVADWGSEDTVRVSVSELLSKVNGTSLIVSNYTLKSFIYQAKSYPADKPNNYITISDNNAEISIEQVLNGGKELKFEALDATTPGSLKSIYYKYEAKDGKNWFTSSSYNLPIDKLSEAELPKKEYTIELHADSGEKDPDPIVSSVPFQGYIYQVGNQTYKYVERDGTINTPRAYSTDPIKDSSTEGPITSVATWSNSQTLVTLPSLSRNGYEFQGWARKDGNGNPSENLIPAGQEWLIKYNGESGFTDENNIIKLYAKWDKVTPISLTLRDISNPEKVYDPIYYQKGRGWFSDPVCTKPITTYPVPSLTSTIQFDSGRSDKRNPENITYEWGFEGFKSNDEKVTYILPSGAIAKNATLSSPSTAYAYWNTNNSVNLPGKANGFDTDATYEFQGWSDDGGKTILTDSMYRPETNSSSTIVLNAIWKDLRVFVLTLDSKYMEGDVKTNISKLYYKPTTTYNYVYNDNTKQKERVLDKNEGWYSDGACETSFVKFNESELPQRVYHIYYNINRTLADDVKASVGEGVDYVWQFGGYGAYIGSEGQILTDSVNNKPVRLSGDDTAEIKWIKPAKVVLPNLYVGTDKDGNNGTHDGWKERDGEKLELEREGNGWLYEPKTEQYTVNLEPTWDMSDVKYTLTLDSSDATNESEIYSEIKYSINDRKWYDEDNNIITSIVKGDKKLPEKKFNIMFDVLQTGTEPAIVENIQSQYPFLGYNGYIDQNGQIIASSLTKQHETISARWGTATPITLPSGPTKDNFKFVSWCERTDDGTLKPVSSPYTPKGETTLYAKWQDLNKYTVSLNHNGATEGTYNELVYWDNSWHASSSSTDIITKINIPKKEYIVNFVVNNSQASSIKSMTSEFPFGGYQAEDGEYFIDVTGSIIEGKTITNDSVRLIANWRAQKGIVLPTPVAPGWKFKGWTKDKDCQDKLDRGENVVWEKEVGEISTPYNPDENGITLYAGWVREESFELRLNIENTLSEGEDLGITYSVPCIYYFKGDGWYSDKDGKIRVNKINIPRRIWTVDFVPNLAGATKPERQEANFTFGGYGDYIDEKGEVNSASSITRDTTSIAQWSVTPYVTLPYYGAENPELNYDKNYTFLGWSEIPNGSVNDILKGENNNKASSYTPKVVKTTLYGVWADNNPYTLTLDNNGATNTSETESSIDYMVGTDGGGHWYEHGDLHEDTTKIDALKVKPKKEWTAVFNTTGPNGETITPPEDNVSSTWEFLGYSDGNQQYVDSSGAIISDASISENTSVKASWGNQTPINLSSVIPNGFSGENKKNGDLYFNGWALEKIPNVALPTIYYPSASDVEDDNTIKLVAIYTEEQTYEVELIDEGATEKGTSVVYYKPNDKNWHPQANTQTVISGITSPKKVWTIVYNSNKDGVSNPTNGSYVFNFEGYYGTSDGTGDGSINENDQYIDRNGNFISGKRPSGAVTLKALWGQPENIKLPSSELTKPGFEFLGWSQSPNAESPEQGLGTADSTNGVDFKNLVDTSAITINDGTITLYGVWKPNTVHTLKLNANGGEYTVDKIYYREKDGWYIDEACTTPFTKLTIPKKTYYVSFETMLPGVDSIDPLQSDYQFNGYRASDQNVYIDAQGGLANAVSLSDDVEAIAQWVNQRAITLPTPNTIQGYDFIGWCKENPSDETPTTIYSPRTSFIPEKSLTLYAYWRDERKWELTLDDNGATSSASVSTLYYSVKNKAWYSNEALTGQIVESITPPQKRVTVEFNNNGADDVPKQNNIVIDWGFQGYEDFINKEGKIKKIPGTNDFVKLSSNREVKANWIINEHSLLPEEDDMLRSNYEFEGWSEDKDNQDVTVVNPYNPTDEVLENKVNNGVITLYAKWRDNNVKRLTLDSNGATTVTTSAIYFKKDEEGRKRWYSTGNNPQDKNIITGVEIPKKEVTVNFVVSSKYGNTPQPITFSSEFMGYYYVDDSGNMDENNRWISDNGIIETNEDLYETGDKTVRAKWGNPPEYSLPIASPYPGWEFLGWSTTEGATTPDTGYGKNDKISLTTEIQPLHDVWRLKPVYTLTLNSGTTTSVGTRRLYYLTGDTWYYNWSGNQTDPPTGKATAITIPKKFYEVTLNYNYGNDAQGNPVPGQPEDVKTSTAVTFMGYGGAISQSGVIVPSYTIQEDTPLDATWGDALSIRLPDVTSIKRDDYECVGWALNKNETDDSLMKKDTYAPNSDGETLYAQWVSTKVYRVSFINNGATSSAMAMNNNTAVNRLYYRVSDGKWYKSITEKTAITSFTPPQKAQSVSFITMLQGVSIQQAAYTHTFKGYHTTQEEAHDTNDKEVISVNNDIAYIAPTWVPTEDMTIYAWWDEPNTPISLVDANKTMKDAALKSEKYFVGWSRYADGNTESILQASSTTPRDPDEDPLGLLIKAREFAPTASQTTLYAILVDTTTYVVELYDNNDWGSTSPTSGEPSKRLYYRPSVNYQDPWFEVNGSPSPEELKKALQSATETIIANINGVDGANPSTYPLRRLTAIGMPSKNATATLHQSWPSESLGNHPDVLSGGRLNNPGWYIGKSTTVTDAIGNVTGYTINLIRNGLSVDSQFTLAWNMTSSGYYFYKTEEGVGVYGDQWISATGSLDTSVVSNISNVATDGTDIDGRPTHTVTLVSKFATTNETLNGRDEVDKDGNVTGHINGLSDYIVKFSDELETDAGTSYKTGYLYRFSGWASKNHSETDPSDNREFVISNDTTYEPDSREFNLYGSWYKNIDESITLVSGVNESDQGSSKGTDNLHYSNSPLGSYWYYIDEEGGRYTLRTKADQETYEEDPTISPTDTGHIVVPMQKYTITFANSSLVYDTVDSSGQEPKNPVSASASAKFVGYKNPDYDEKDTSTNRYKHIPYVIDAEGHLGSNLFRKDSSLDERELDKATELIAEWGVSSQTIDASTITDIGGMDNAGYNHVGWSEIYGFDKDGKIYFINPNIDEKGEQVPEASKVKFTSYTYEPSYDLTVTVNGSSKTFIGQEPDKDSSDTNEDYVKTFIENTADKLFTTGTIHDKVKALFQDNDQVGSGKIFESAKDRMALANAYYYVAAGTENYTPTHTTTLYNVWAENYTLAVLAPQNLSTSPIDPIFGTSPDATEETIILSSNTVKFTSSYIAPSSTSHTLTYPKDTPLTEMGASDTGVLIYIALFHGDGSSSVLAKTLSLESNISKLSAALGYVTGSLSSGVIPNTPSSLFGGYITLSGNEGNAIENNTSVKIEKTIVDANNIVRAIGLRIKGHISSYGTVDLVNPETMVNGSGKLMNNDNKVKIAFEDVVPTISAVSGSASNIVPDSFVAPIDDQPIDNNSYVFNLYCINGTKITNIQGIEEIDNSFPTSATSTNEKIKLVAEMKDESTINIMIQGTLNKPGKYELRFRLKYDNTYSNIIKVNLTIKEPVVLPSSSFTFSKTSSGYTITGTTATFDPDELYTIPSTGPDGSPVTSIDNGGLGGSKQNGVFNTDNDGTTGQVGNWQNNRNLGNIVIPDSVTTLGVGTFHSRNGQSGLKKIYLPKKLKTIPGYCFSDNPKLKTVRFPEELTTIGPSAFYDCQGWLQGKDNKGKDLSCGTLPTTLETIDSSAFGRYTYVDGTKPLFDYNGTFAQWKSVSVNGTNYFKVRCSDGTVVEYNGSTHSPTW